jgi:hypothetical protein
VACLKRNPGTAGRAAPDRDPVVALPRFLLLSDTELAGDYLAPHAVRAGRAAGGVGGRVAARGARAPLTRATRPVGHAEPVAVAPAEQVKQPALVVTEQQLRDASHLRDLLLVLESRYNANAARRYRLCRAIARRDDRKDSGLTQDMCASPKAYPPTT